MPDPIDHLRETLADLMRWITEEHLRAAVIGGVAAGLQGQPGLTLDLPKIFEIRESKPGRGFGLGPGLGRDAGAFRTHRTESNLASRPSPTPGPAPAPAPGPGFCRSTLRDEPSDFGFKNLDVAAVVFDAGAEDLPLK